ncbi:hypothetical protein [Nocardia fluminea]|uniref:hypothetical protein n=1 Tax=Nocardia fluminea TaxID=134984 RepID=UPI00340C95DD
MDSGARRSRGTRSGLRGRRAPRGGHPTDLTAIRHTPEYLELFEKTIADSPDAATAEQALLAAYPDAGLRMAADLGTKVAKGEYQNLASAPGDLAATLRFTRDYLHRSHRRHAPALSGPCRSRQLEMPGA